ncbi:unnamed protein product [Adineta ricciae]|uniref:Uncharacterized protein n=1 Tax=Adineta ricciae TaxID=249248 RepID=A0A815W114_ADIRI|nr:unnamed protein product [Adineta ricciae]CAF1539061.1 unnamed protein product [Adineta ricciae]
MANNDDENSKQSSAVSNSDTTVLPWNAIGSTRSSVFELEKSLEQEINKLLLQQPSFSKTDSVPPLHDGRNIMKGLVIECPPLNEMNVGTCAYGHSKCSNVVSESQHITLCAKHYTEMMEKFDDKKNIASVLPPNYNQKVYSDILPVIDRCIDLLVTLKAFDYHEKQFYQSLVCVKAFILVYRRYLNPGNEQLMNTVLMTLREYPERSQAMISTVVSVLGYFGIMLVVRDLGLELPVGAALATSGSLTALIGIVAPNMFGARIAALPALPIILGSAIGVTGVSHIITKLWDWNKPPPPRNEWCRITLWLFT